MGGEGNRADALKAECSRKKDKMESFSEEFRRAFFVVRSGRKT